MVIIERSRLVEVRPRPHMAPSSLCDQFLERTVELGLGCFCPVDVGVAQHRASRRHAFDLNRSLGSRLAHLRLFGGHFMNL